jgi:hypothetical protein
LAKIVTKAGSGGYSMSEDKITRDYMYPLFLKAASKMREEMKKEKEQKK